MQHHVPFRQTHICIAASATLQEIEAEAKKEDVDKFLLDCKSFLIESILQLQRRFDLENDVHDIVQCLLPTNAASVIPRSLGAAWKKLPYLHEIIDASKLYME